MIAFHRQPERDPDGTVDVRDDQGRIRVTVAFDPDGPVVLLFDERMRQVAGCSSRDGQPEVTLYDASETLRAYASLESDGRILANFHDPQGQVQSTFVQSAPEPMEEK